MRSDDIKSVNKAARRLVDRINRNCNKLVGIGAVSSLAAGAYLGSVINDKIKKRNERINRERRKKNDSTKE